MTLRAAMTCVVLAALAVMPRSALADETPSNVGAEAFAGAGVGTRSFVRPTSEGTQALKSSLFPAAEVALRLEAWPRARFSLAGLVHAQTSIGLKVEERPLFALPNEVGVRAEHLDLSAVPSWRLGCASDALALAFPVGFTLRRFQTVVRDVPTPSYSLAGPHLRVELVAPLKPWLTLRVGPELHWIAFLGHDLREGGTDSQGIALGGEAALRLTLGAGISLEVGYRESRAFAGHAGSGASFEDVERFATLRIVGAL